MDTCVLIDVDGVIADLVGEICSRVGWLPEDVCSTDFKEVFPSSVLSRVWDIMSAPGFVLGLYPYIGAREFVSSLVNRGHEVVAVTRPHKANPRWAGERTMWLQNIGIDRVVHTSEKHRVRGDVLIEDDPRNISGWLNRNPLGHAILVDRPWNRDAFHSAKAGLIHAHAVGRVKRAVGYDHVLAILESR